MARCFRTREIFRKDGLARRHQTWILGGKKRVKNLEDHLKMNNTIWDKYKGTDEEYEVLKFFIDEYNKELRRLWNENAE